MQYLPIVSLCGMTGWQIKEENENGNHEFNGYQ